MNEALPIISCYSPQDLNSFPVEGYDTEGCISDVLDQVKESGLPHNPSFANENEFSSGANNSMLIMRPKKSLTKRRDIQIFIESMGEEDLISAANNISTINDEQGLEDTEYDNSTDNRNSLGMKFENRRLSFGRSATLRVRDRVVDNKAVCLGDPENESGMRLFLIHQISASEENYILGLRHFYDNYVLPLSLRTSSGGILTQHEVAILFPHTEEFIRLHQTFLNSVEQKLMSWNESSCIGDVILVWIKEALPLYEDYSKLYRDAWQTYFRLKQERPAFLKFVHSVETSETEKANNPVLIDLIRLPLQKIQNFTLTLTDISKYTPQFHPDFMPLRTCLCVLNDLTSFHRHVPSKYIKIPLIYEDLVVEIDSDLRKARHVFLFSDVLVCAHRKDTSFPMVSERNYECKWYASLGDITFDPPKIITELPKSVMLTENSKLLILLEEIRSLQSKLKFRNKNFNQLSVKLNQPNSSEDSKTHRGVKKSTSLVKNTKGNSRSEKRLEKLQLDYWYLSANVPLRLYINDRVKTFLFHSQDDRKLWIEAIKAAKGVPKIRQEKLKGSELVKMLSNIKQIRSLRLIGEHFTKSVERLEPGTLEIRIVSATLPKARAGLYCTLETSYFGNYIEHSERTLPSIHSTNSPLWDRSFTLESDGAERLKIKIAYPSLLIEEQVGVAYIDLSNLCHCHGEKTQVKENLANGGQIHLVLTYLPSKFFNPASLGSFSLPLESLAENDPFREHIPFIVRTILNEIEKRGLKEKFIYRLAGNNSDIQSVIDAFASGNPNVETLVSETDVHALANVFKRFLRGLPEPLFVSSFYRAFCEATCLSDPEARESCVVALLYRMPIAHFNTSLFIIKHFKKVAEFEEINKMNILNLSLMLGPNVFRPQNHGNNYLDATLNVTEQVKIINFILQIPDEVLFDTIFNDYTQKLPEEATLRKLLSSSLEMNTCSVKQTFSLSQSFVCNIDEHNSFDNEDSNITDTSTLLMQ